MTRRDELQPHLDRMARLLECVAEQMGKPTPVVFVTAEDAISLRRVLSAADTPPEVKPRYLTYAWTGGGIFDRSKEEFEAWLNRVAPAGARLASVIVHPPWPGRPEMGETRECLFELPERAQ